MTWKVLWYYECCHKFLDSNDTCLLSILLWKAFQHPRWVSLLNSEWWGTFALVQGFKSVFADQLSAPPPVCEQLDPPKLLKADAVSSFCLWNVMHACGTTWIIMNHLHRFHDWGHGWGMKQFPTGYNIGFKILMEKGRRVLFRVSRPVNHRTVFHHHWMLRNLLLSLR